eukprot:6479114-Amphidinium_carterae.1
MASGCLVPGTSRGSRASLPIDFERASSCSNLMGWAEDASCHDEAQTPAACHGKGRAELKSKLRAGMA